MRHLTKIMTISMEPYFFLLHILIFLKHNIFLSRLTVQHQLQWWCNIFRCLRFKICKTENPNFSQHYSINPNSCWPQYVPFFSARSFHCLLSSSQWFSSVHFVKIYCSLVTFCCEFWIGLHFGCFLILPDIPQIFSLGLLNNT